MSDWNTNIIKEFRENEGRVGGPFAGAPMIILHTIGAKSGREHETPLVYFPQDDGDMIVVGSAAGAPKHPAWFHNLVANPRFPVEVGTSTFDVQASVLGEAEHDEMWPRVVAQSPGFGEYQEKTDRVIPLIRLTRAA